MSPTVDASPPANQTPPPKRQISLSFSPWLIVFLLLLAIGIMFFLWKPWQANIKADARTVEVAGEAVVKAEPDEFAFYPTYEFKDADKDKALAAMSKRSDEIIAELKKLGVKDSQIKSNSSGYDNGSYFPIETGNTTTYTLSLTATVEKSLAQKVQDYLVSTSPSGAVSPQATFSTAKQKELESKARDEATKDARAKAEQSAKNLGFSLAEVKSVADGVGFDRPIPLYYGTDMGASAPSSSEEKLSVQPGENELAYTVTVVYFIK